MYKNSSDKLKDYIKFLKKNSFHKGNHLKGEIELITQKEKIIATQKIIQDSLTQNNILPEWGKVGIVYEDNYCIVVRDAVIFPSKRVGTYIRLIWKSQLNGNVGVAILPVLNKKIILQRNFRHATRRWEIEIPRGGGEKDESIIKTIQRELTSETGFSPLKFKKLGEITPETGILSSVIPIYFVEVNKNRGEPSHEHSEAIDKNLIMVSPKQLDSLILEGKVRDAYTICAFTLAKLKGMIK